GGPGELLFRHCDFGAGVTGMTVEVAGEGSVEFSLVGGPVLAALTLATPTADSYTYTTLRAAVSAAGVHDVHLRLRGPLRLAHVGFSG
ncbi:carbohydrate-binding protein, partial [Streptomyces europaeiscabiei]